MVTVLPRFEVSLDSPGQLEREEDIQVTVRARYVFGENVQGRVKLNATLEASSRRESLPFHDKTVPLVSVCVCVGCGCSCVCMWCGCVCVCVGVVDKSLSLLAEACKSLEKRYPSANKIIMRA